MVLVCECKDKFRQMQNDSKKIKLVIWDLDNTLWNGILAENDCVVLRKNIVDIIKSLDKRGILQSVVSKNNYGDAMGQLKKFGIDEYFIYPQIGWERKSYYVQKIINLVNIGEDTILFIDDQEFEREEVMFTLPQVRCIDADNLDNLLSVPALNPTFITPDASNRRHLYQNDIKRNKVKETFSGTEQEFLKLLDMKFTISFASKEDLQRVEELTVRTHQLNSTGYTYSYQELENFLESQNHMLLITELEDKYGTYGKIGLSLIECIGEIWTIKLLLMSCRVVSRGVGTVLLSYIMNMAKEAGKKLRAEFVHTDRNRMMYLTYKLAGFKELEERDSVSFLESDLSYTQSYPDYLKLYTK